MLVSFPRAARSVVVCLAVALALALVLVLALASRAAARTSFAMRAGHARDARRTEADTRVRDKYPSEPLTIGGEVLAFPPRADVSGRATVVYLHGIHGLAENGCPWLRAGASELGWLVCPEANVVEAPGFTWGGSTADKRAIVARAVAAARAEGADPDAQGVLVGFSQGAWVALELVRAEHGRYRGLVLLGADVTPHAAELARAGITRVAFVAGALDGAAEPMKRTAEQLRREGLDARFVSLGRVGHTYVAEDPAALTGAIAWAGGA